MLIENTNKNSNIAILYNKFSILDFLIRNYTKSPAELILTLIDELKNDIENISYITFGEKNELFEMLTIIEKEIIESNILYSKLTVLQLQKFTENLYVNK